MDLTPISAPAVTHEPNEFDQAVAQVIDLAKTDQWAQVIVPTEADAVTFRRKFGDAANRADKSRRFAADVVNADGTVTLKFTVKEKVERKSKDAEPDPAPVAAK